MFLCLLEHLSGEDLPAMIAAPRHVSHLAIVLPKIHLSPQQPSPLSDQSRRNGELLLETNQGGGALSGYSYLELASPTEDQKSMGTIRSSPGYRFGDLCILKNFCCYPSWN